MAIWRAACVLLLLAVAAEAAEIQTFNPASCDGSATNTFFVNGNTCQIFEDQGAVLISGISSDTRVSIHNQQYCEMDSQVAQIYGPGCVVQGMAANNIAIVCGKARFMAGGSFINLAIRLLSMDIYTYRYNDSVLLIFPFGNINAALVLMLL